MLLSAPRRRERNWRLCSRFFRLCRCALSADACDSHVIVNLRKPLILTQWPLPVEHFGRTYATATGTFTAVDDLSFAVAAGEIVGLIGPNGAGKTTTLRSLAGILRPTSGRVAHRRPRHRRRPARGQAAAGVHARRAAPVRVPDRRRAPAAGRRGSTASPTSSAARAALLEELELTGKERSLPGELSRGMRQKVVIACGLVRDATTLLFDEPLTGLDPIGIRRMRDTIVARARAGAAILLSSHLLHLVEEICTRVIIMDRGRKIADGTFAELASRADLADGRLEPRADLPARHRPRHADRPDLTVLGASLYIIVCSARNRLRVRLRRLREPRYLIGAIVGAAYLYFSFFARFRASQRRRGAAARARRTPPASLGRAGRAAGRRSPGVALLAVAAAALDAAVRQRPARVLRAEMQFLFPAPVSRRQLLIHRMLRSQLGMLFGALIIGARRRRRSSGFVAAAAVASASWLLLVTGKVYFTGVTLARARLGVRATRATRRVAWLPLGVLAAALAIVGVR